MPAGVTAVVARDPQIADRRRGHSGGVGKGSVHVVGSLVVERAGEADRTTGPIKHVLDQSVRHNVVACTNPPDPG